MPSLPLPFDQITVDGFRGLRSMEVSALGGINLFVGENNSGKTSVLEAIALLSNPANSNEWLHVIRRRDHGRLDESIVQSLRWCFAAPVDMAPTLDAQGESFSTRCRFTSSGAHPIRSMDCQFIEQRTVLSAKQVEELALPYLDAGEATVRTGQVDVSLTWVAEDASASPQERAPESAALRVNEFSAESYRRPLPGITPRSRFGCAYAALMPYSYQLNTVQVESRSSQLFLDDSALVLDLMRDFDPDVLNIEVASFTGIRPAIYVKHRRLGVAPLSIFGDAMRRCLLLATTMTNLGPGAVLLLDEVEVGIHMKSLPKVFRWLKVAARRVGVQVFATTHSLEVVDALLAAEAGEEDLSVYRIRQEATRTACQHFPLDSLQRLRYERGLDIR